MKKLTYLSIALFMLWLPTYGQVISIGEKDRDGNWKTPTGTMREEYINHNIVDINSTLKISLNYDSIVNAAGVEAGLPAELADKLDKVHTALKDRKRTLQRLNELADSFDYELFTKDTAAYNTYISDLQKEASVVIDLLKIDSRITPIMLGIESDEKYVKYYTATEQVLNAIRAEINSSLDSKGVYVQFGAWLVRKSGNVPLHLDGFDEIALQQRYEVERWQIIPTAEQIKQLQQVQQYAKENRDAGIALFKKMAQNQIDLFRKIVEEEATNRLNSLKTELDKIIPGPTAQVKPVLERAKGLQDKITIFITTTKSMIKKYESVNLSNPDIAQLALNITADTRYFIAELTTIQTDTKQLISAISELRSAVKPYVAQLEILLTSTTNDFLTDVLKQLGISDTFSVRNAAEGMKVDVAALQFGKEVFQLSLSQMKTSTELDLADTGVRDEGDVIVFKFLLKTQDGVKSLIEENRRIYLFKVLPHIIGTVGIVFTHPFTSTAIQADFQIAPYYNVLFKGFIDRNRRRKSVSYNQIFDWSVGLHLSAPDYDKDDVPELGAGLVISGLHDYLQTGVAYNLFTGDPYWFFGLRIPLPTFNH